MAAALHEVQQSVRQCSQRIEAVAKGQEGLSRLADRIESIEKTLGGMASSLEKLVVNH